MDTRLYQLKLVEAKGIFTVDEDVVAAGCFGGWCNFGYFHLFRAAFSLALTASRTLPSISDNLSGLAFRYFLAASRP